MATLAPAVHEPDPLTDAPTYVATPFTQKKWDPADLPRANALLSSIQIDIVEVLDKRSVLSDQLSKLTHQFAALGVELNTLRDLETAILSVLEPTPIPSTLPQ